LAASRAKASYSGSGSKPSGNAMVKFRPRIEAAISHE
jgi:hypothetical protein